MVRDFTKREHVFDAPEQELKDQLIQHRVTRVHLGEVLNHDPFDGHYWCHRRCESDYTNGTKNSINLCARPDAIDNIKFQRNLRVLNILHKLMT